MDAKQKGMAAGRVAVDIVDRANPEAAAARVRVEIMHAALVQCPSCGFRMGRAVAPHGCPRCGASGGQIMSVKR